MKKTINIFIIMIILFIYGCKKDDFDPVKNYEDKMVIMGILNNNSNIQFIKIQKTYEEQTTNGSEKTLKNLKVQVIENASAIYTFRDTIIPGVTNYAVYYNKDLKIQPGLGYSLEIDDEKYQLVCATAIAPYPNYSITYKNNLVVLILNSGSLFAEYNYTYEYHIYYEYLQKTNNEWLYKRMEVPIQINISDKTGDTTVIYPTQPKEKILTIDSIKVPYSNFAYTVSKINDAAGGDSIKSLSRFVYFTTVETNLYGYLFKGFTDKYSIRLDQPDWSNVLNGEGVFGIICTDSRYLYSDTPILGKRGSL
jgi:hypothetical protein